MPKIHWSRSAHAMHLAYADTLLEEFGYDTMMDYLRLVEEAIEQIKRFPEAGSPTISIAPGRRVQLTSKKQYQLHYDYDKVSDEVVIVAMFK